MRQFFLYLILCFLPLGLFGQDLNNLRCQWIPFSTQNSPLDSLLILSESIAIQDVKPAYVEKNKLVFVFDKETQNLHFELKETINPPDSILICYRVFPTFLTQKQALRSQTLYDSGGYQDFIDPRDKAERQDQNLAIGQREEFFSSDKLTKSGSITRGISVGSQQDVFVNSALNLQLEGQITDDLNLSMLVSDQNVPFQPEGNTQQLQEFDKVLVRLSHSKGVLTAGNIVLQHRTGHFLRYYKNIYGATLGVNLGNEEDKLSSQTQVGVAVARGQFHHYQLEVQEGVQGAYKLRGANNEQFIIIQAGSERIFLDGKLLKRGFNYDYIIDYNNAELTFNSNVLITAFSRVRVEFEYTSQNYNRSIWQASHRQNVGKWSFFTHFYREKDNKNAITGNLLSDADKRILSEAGDNLEAAISESVSIVEEFNANRILYTRRDTLVGGETVSIFERATSNANLLLDVRFSDVGTGMGDYILGQPTANGRVYVWAGAGLGNFLPVRVLAAPNQRQMAVVGTVFELDKHQSFLIESSFTKRDKNLFSTLDSQDDTGFAIWGGYQNKGKPIKNSLFLEGYSWQAELDFEYDEQHFQPIDRFRSVEFDRNWSANLEKPAPDHIAHAMLGLQKGNFNQFRYEVSYRKRAEEVNGWQQNATLNKKLGFLQFNNDFFLLQNDQQTQQSDWVRYTGEVYLHHKKIRPGYVFSMDKNKVRQLANDSVSTSAMYFEEHKFYVQQGDSSKQRFSLEYALRKDFLPQFGKILPYTESETLGAGSETRFKTDVVKFNFTYRKLNPLTIDSTRKTQETIMGRLDWRGKWLKNHLQSSLTFTTSTGREARREFVFLQVNPGQGTHTWRDDNEDGIQDLGEFYEAINPDERDYAKIFVPTSDFINAFSNDFIYQLNIKTPRKWLKMKGLRNFLGRLSSVSSWRISKRITNDGIAQRFIPFSTNIAEDELLSSKETLRSTLFFNRQNPKFGLEFSYFSSKQKNLLTGGFESRNTENLNLKNRFNIGKQWNAQLEVGQGSKSNASDFLENRNYDIWSYRLSPQLAWQPKNQVRLTFAYLWRNKENRLTRQEKAKINEWSADLRYTQLASRTVNAKLRFVNIDFTGNTNTPVGYELLEALQQGKNYTWEANIQQRLSNGLRLTFTYNGRKSAQLPIVHLGNLQLTALF